MNATILTRSPSMRSTLTTIYSFVVIIESVSEQKERHCIFCSGYGFEPEIQADEPSDIYWLGVGDGEVFSPPTLPESGEYWDGYCFGLRSYWLSAQGKEELAIGM